MVCAQNLRAVSSEKRILSPAFHGSYFAPPSGFSPATAPMRKTLCATFVIFLFGAEFGLCVLLRCAGCFLGAFHRIEKQPAHLGLLNLRFRRPFRIREFGLRLNDDGLDSRLLRLPNHLFIRKNDHFPFRIIPFPAARETVMLENIQNIFPNFRHIIIGITIQ